MKNIMRRRIFWQIFFMALSLAFFIAGGHEQGVTYLVGSVIIGCMDMER